MAAKLLRKENAHPAESLLPYTKYLHSWNSQFASENKYLGTSLALVSDTIADQF